MYLAWFLVILATANARTRMHGNPMKVGYRYDVNFWLVWECQADRQVITPQAMLAVSAGGRFPLPLVRYSIAVESWPPV